MTKLEHALALAAKGFAVFPIKPNSKAPPLLTGWPERASVDPEVVESYWQAVPEANIGIHCDGLVVIDVDVAKGGDESLKLLEQEHGKITTLVVRTSTNGRHFYFRSSIDVSNSVAQLGSGLDIRSRGGYVVAPGSTLPAGDYRVEVEAPIADAPEWLVLKLGTSVLKTGTPIQTVPDALSAVVEAAQTWLKAQEGAVEGQGGDQHTYVVACGLRDRGLSPIQAYALLQEWNGTCSPPWSMDALWAKVLGAYRYGQNEPGVRKPIVASDFSVSQIEQTVAAVQHTIQKGHRLGKGGANQAPYLIKGILSQRSYTLMFGAPGQGKSFCALDIGYHIAAGKDWMGHKTRQGPVIYVPFEGEGGLHKREQALIRQYGSADVPLFVLPGGYNLRESKGAQAFTTDIAGIVASEFAGKHPMLFVLDTLAHALQGGDENSAQDISAFNSAVQNLIAAWGACVMVLHHSGKNKSAGARGSSALLAAVDTELGIDGWQITASKQRDVEAGAPIGFKLHTLPVGMDEDGELITSCVVLPDTIAPVSSVRLTGHKQTLFSALCRLSPNNDPIPQKQWREACKDDLGTRAATFGNVRDKLLDLGLIEIDNLDNVTRRMA